MFHYLDDFLTLGPPSSPVCQANVDTSFTVFNHLGLPPNHEKCEGPATCLVFLGIELDSVTQIVRLPAEKFNRCMSLLQSWSNTRTCHRQELESLIGHLHHACEVVRPGRTFLRRMIDLLAHFRNRSHPIRLNVEFRRDIHWWLAFFRDWNGISFFLSRDVSQLPDLFVASDAAGSIGFGAMRRSHWCFGSWSFLSSPQSIAFMELLPIVVAAHLWGASWSRLQVQFLCHNRSVVDALTAGTARSPPLIHLLRSLTRVACLNNFTFSARHNPGRSNSEADALSRFRFQEFHRLAPNMDREPSPIPHKLLVSLVPP